MKENITCLSCNFSRSELEQYHCPDYECPQCSKVYSKLKKKFNPDSKKENHESSTTKQQREGVIFNLISGITKLVKVIKQDSIWSNKGLSALEAELLKFERTGLLIALISLVFSICVDKYIFLFGAFSGVTISLILRKARHSSSTNMKLVFYKMLTIFGAVAVSFIYIHSFGYYTAEKGFSDIGDYYRAQGVGIISAQEYYKYETAERNKAKAKEAERERLSTLAKEKEEEERHKKGFIINSNSDEAIFYKMEADHYIKATLKNPESYRPISYSDIKVKGGSFTVTVDYTASNGYDAVINLRKTVSL